MVGGNQELHGTRTNIYQRYIEKPYLKPELVSHILTNE
jgi:hypothetical protein